MLTTRLYRTLLTYYLHFL